MEVFKWLNDQLLRMDWLAWLVSRLVENVFGMDMAGRSGASVHFFIYDVIKIFILLAVLIFSISWVQSHFPPERTRRILAACRASAASLPAHCWARSLRSVRARRFRSSSVSPARDCRWE
jgi:uncharacterized membrane protein YraQ (UPF0718 family)